MSSVTRSALFLRIGLLAVITVLLFSSSEVIARELPSGFGWQALPNTSIQVACPADDPHGMYTDGTMTSTTWYNFSQNCKYWFDDWSGAAVDDAHQQLVLFGGGHTDSSNDMVLALSLNGTAKWNLLRSPTVPVPSPDAQNWEGLAPYFVLAGQGGKYLPGAKPSARHTYGALQYVPSQNKVFAFGGSVANGGYFSTELWTLDLGTATWSLTSPYSSVPGGSPTTAYNPSNGHIVMTDNNLGLYDFDPATGKYIKLSSNANLGNTYHSSAAVDPIHNFLVIVSSDGGAPPAGDYYPGVATTKVVRGFDLSGADNYATHVWDDPSCNIINGYGGLQWDPALGLLVGYPGGGNQIYFFNAGPSAVNTAYGTVPSQKCLTVPIGSQKGVDYPQDPDMPNGAYFTGVNQRFAYFPSLDVFLLANGVSGNAWILRLNNIGNGPNFSVAAAPAALTLAQGSQGSSTITTAVSGGFNNAISLSATGAPSGTTATLNPGTIAAPGAGTSALTIAVGANTAPGTYPITVTATGGGITQTTAVSLTVTSSQSGLTVSANPASLSMQPGTQASSTITTTIQGSFNSNVALTATGVPGGTTIGFAPNAIAAPGAGTSAMTVSVGANTQPGTYPITVTATGGGIQQSMTVALTVSVAQSGLAVSANPASLSIQQGAQGVSTISTTIQGMFKSGVAFAAAGMPAGTTVSFNPPNLPAPGAGRSTMTVIVGAKTATGAYPLTVSALSTGVGRTATTTVSLTVTPSGGGVGNGITVSDLSGYGQSNRPISVGRFFRAGDIPQFAQAVVGSTPLLTQCDVKNRWPDGSLKFAIISFVLPSVSTGGTAVTFQNQSTGNNTGYLQQGDMLDPSYDYDAVMQLSGTVSPSISARSMIQAGQFRYWLQGPIVTAVIVEDRNGRTDDVNTDGQSGNPLHPIFESWFYPQGKKVEVGFTLENTWSSSDASQSARNQTFGLSLSTGYASPAVRLTQPAFTEWAFTRWRRAFWIGSDPAPVQFNWNPQYMVTTAAYPVYDVNYLPNASVVNAEYATYNNLVTKFPDRLTIPGFDDPNNGGIVNYDQAMDATGDPPNGSWIGLFPTWDIDYLLTGDARLQKQMTDNADLAGRFPMWFREADHNAGSGGYFDYPHTGTVDTYGHVVSINARQQVTLALFNWQIWCSGGAADNINAGAPLSYGGWPALDTSHLPDFGFVPYSLTGKYYYLEQEEMEAAYAAGFRTGCYGLSNNWWRQGYLGMLELLVRDQAWALRALDYGSFLAPDGDPEGPYFKDKVLNNVARMEGEHGLTLDINDTSDRNTAYQWGYSTAGASQASNPSPLGAWDVDAAAYSYAQNGTQNNVNPNTLKAAGSMFQEAFMNVTLGMTRQLGIANTKELLTFAAKRPFHVLLDPGVNHYLIGQYCYPSQYTDGSWVADWPNFQANYIVLPSQWGQAQTTDDLRGFQQLSGVSFMTDITVDSIKGQDVWTWFKANKPNQSEFQTSDPRWSITPYK